MKLNSCNYSFQDLSYPTNVPYTYFNFKAPRG